MRGRDNENYNFCGFERISKYKNVFMKREEFEI